MKDIKQNIIDYYLSIWSNFGILYFLLKNISSNKYNPSDISISESNSICFANLPEIHAHSTLGW